MFTSKGRRNFLVARLSLHTQWASRHRFRTLSMQS